MENYMTLIMAGSSAGDAAAGAFAGLLVIVGIVIGVGIYLIPTIVAFARKRVNKGSILVLNLFLGWSLIGWVIALVWATKNEDAGQL